MFFKQFPSKKVSLSHFFGCVCGAGISGKPSSIIEFEKRWNAAPSLEREAFVQELLANIPPRPADMDRIVVTNRVV
jgi:hydroxyacylglutathione hydrolase